MGNVLLLPYQFRVQLDVLVLLQQLELELLPADVGDAGVGLKKNIVFGENLFLTKMGKTHVFIEEIFLDMLAQAAQHLGLRARDTGKAIN